jgi:uncharacterized protein
MNEHLYVDANVAVKLFHPHEEGAVEAAAAMEAAAVLVTSRLTYTEVGRAIDAVDYEGEAATLRAWDVLWEEHQVVELTPAISAHALSLACHHGLRSSDAIHLASALAVRNVPLRFATWDARLWDAARAVGLRVVPATRPGAVVAA